MERNVSAIIPAFNEQDRIGETLGALFKEEWVHELIVVDDGSHDSTAEIAAKWTDKVIRLPQNVGKAKAIEVGSKVATQPILLFLDADLRQSANLAKELIEPIWKADADMTIALLPPAKNGGYGLVKKLAIWGIYRRTGYRLEAPLSGQRAIKRIVFEQYYRGDQGFGIEVGLSIDCLLGGCKVQEVNVPFTHREMGKNIPGFVHRIRQGVSVCQSLFVRR
jgi:glycosyltransferase involved in cell wall biosynthesis